MSKAVVPYSLANEPLEGNFLPQFTFLAIPGYMYVSSDLTCDVIVTSFYKGLTPNFNTTSTIYPGMCVPSFVLLRLRVAEILRVKKWGNLPPAAGGWRGGPAAAGLT